VHTCRNALPCLAAALAVALAGCDDGGRQPFTAAWRQSPDRRWVGPGFWANRLQDWEVANGRLRSVHPLPLRTVHLLTRRLSTGGGTLRIELTLGPSGSAEADGGQSSAGVLLGAGPSLDYRAAALVHHSRGPGAGLYAGVDTEGRLFLRDLQEADRTIVSSDSPRGPADSVSLRLLARAEGGSYTVTVRAALWNATADTISITTEGIPPERLVGSLAVVSDARGAAPTAFWFSDLRVSGTKLERHDDRTAGPILGTQHTLSRGLLTLTAQLMPIGDGDSPSAELQVRRGSRWTTLRSAPIVVPGYTATFVVPDWDAQADVPFRVRYDLRALDGTVVPHVLPGTVRREPTGDSAFVVAAFTGNHNVAEGVDQEWFDWARRVWFPHADIVGHVRAHDPDFLFFSGDQVYEGGSPTRADFTEPYEDYLYKWYLWMWAFGELTAEIPAVTIPDDHDVFHGNVWGAGGRATPEGLTGADAQDAGGYRLPADWVTMVQRTQTSHLPAPYDPTPVEQAIGVYYTDILYGGVSFAVLEDRKFKSAPKGLLPRARVWNGWPLERSFDAKRDADVAGAELLGPRQLAFLEDWAADWRDGAWMKVVLSQTLFANVATLPDTALTGSVIPSLPILGPGEYAEGERAVSDMDSNGWPQTGRNRALRAMRKGFALHLAGDQHLGSTVRYGIDAWGDAGYALCVPSVANFWPRRWYPAVPGGNREPGAPRYTGDYEDGFGNKITVLAVSNPTRSGKEPARLHDRAPGYGIARFDRRTRSVTMAAWPRWADPAHDPPYAGWPVRVDQVDNYARGASGYLPTVRVIGLREPVIQVVDEATGEIVYTLRLAGATFTPMVFASGPHTVRIGEPGTPRWRTFAHLRPGVSGSDTLEVSFE
jgi:alkaline phosphatase D